MQSCLTNRFSSHCVLQKLTEEKHPDSSLSGAQLQYQAGSPTSRAGAAAQAARPCSQWQPQTKQALHGSRQCASSLRRGLAPRSVNSNIRGSGVAGSGCLTGVHAGSACLYRPSYSAQPWHGPPASSPRLTEQGSTSSSGMAILCSQQSKTQNVRACWIAAASFKGICGFGFTCSYENTHSVF